MSDAVTTTIDLTPIVTPLITLAGAILTAAAGAIIVWVQNKAKERGIAITDQQVTALEGAVKTSVGSMVVKLAQGAKPLEQITVNDPGVRQEAQRIIDAIPTAVAALGPNGQPVSADTLATKIVAGIGNAIAADPTIPTVPVTTSTAAAAVDTNGKRTTTASTTTAATDASGAAATPPRAA